MPVWTRAVASMLGQLVAGCGPGRPRCCRATRGGAAPALATAQIESILKFLRAGGRFHAVLQETGFTAEQMVL
eukprot:11187373-Lingulodinium_polyedra.AAC.1